MANDGKFNEEHIRNYFLARYNTYKASAIKAFERKKVVYPEAKLVMALESREDWVNRQVTSKHIECIKLAVAAVGNQTQGPSGCIKLFLAVFNLALDDLIDGKDKDRKSAIEYLNSNMVHLEHLGVNLEYTDRLFRQLGIDAKLNR